jgi:hypothetical protein
VKALEAKRFIQKAGSRNTQPGFQGVLYQPTTRAYVVLLLARINPDVFIRKADEDTLITELTALTLFFNKGS